MPQQQQRVQDRCGAQRSGAPTAQRGGYGGCCGCLDGGMVILEAY